MAIRGQAELHFEFLAESGELDAVRKIARQARGLATQKTLAMTGRRDCHI